MASDQSTPHTLQPVHPALCPVLSGKMSSHLLQDFTSNTRFPLVESGAVTFVWVGHADGVSLLRWIHGGVDRAEFTRVPDTALWVLRIAVEDEGRFEYKLAVLKNGHEEWMLDPLNPARAGDPFGENSVCKTYGYERPQWSRQQGSAPGEIHALPVQSAVFEELREESVYLPANYSSQQRYPVIIIHDGADYVNYAHLQQSLDNLIASGDIPAVVVALLQTHDRMGEYSRGRRHARYLVYDLLPELEKRFSLSPHPRDRILLGASLGAVVSLATVFRYPGVFGGVLLHSGSFILDERKLQGRPHPVFSRVARLVKAFKRAPTMPQLRAFVSTGELEGLASENLALAELLQQNGIDVLFKSAWDGHHWHNWRNQLRDGLVWVLQK